MQTDKKAGAGAFAIGMDRVSKPLNAGTLYRVAAAFGGAYGFTIGADYSTSKQPRQAEGTAEGRTREDDPIPFLEFPDIAAFAMPAGFQLVGIEITDDAVELPSFRHPRNAVYVLGPERGILQPRLLDACDFTIKIPTRFSLNVVMAGLTVLYDRRKSLRPGGSAAARATAEQALESFLNGTRALCATPPPAYKD